jgi:hypothetical protein
MASPISRKRNPGMASQRALKQPKLKPKGPNLGGEKPYPMPRINDDMVYTQPFPRPNPYSPIKQTKSVGKVYKTY